MMVEIAARCSPHLGQTAPDGQEIRSPLRIQNAEEVSVCEMSVSALFDERGTPLLFLSTALLDIVVLGLLRSRGAEL